MLKFALGSPDVFIPEQVFPLILRLLEPDIGGLPPGSVVLHSTKIELLEHIVTYVVGGQINQFISIQTLALRDDKWLKYLIWL